MKGGTDEELTDEELTEGELELQELLLEQQRLEEQQKQTLKEIAEMKKYADHVEEMFKEEELLFKQLTNKKITRKEYDEENIKIQGKIDAVPDPRQDEFLF